jgi:hypothetical protein
LATASLRRPSKFKRASILSFAAGDVASARALSFFLGVFFFLGTDGTPGEIQQSSALIAESTDSEVLNMRAICIVSRDCNQITRCTAWVQLTAFVDWVGITDSLELQAFSTPNAKSQHKSA